MPSRKKHTKNIHHEYISTKQNNHGYFFRLSNYFVLLSMILIEMTTNFVFPENAYVLVIFAILGYDVAGIVSIFNNFMSKRKRRA